MKTHNKKQSKYSGVYFAIVVILIYGVLFSFYPQRIRQALWISGTLLLQILPVFALVILTMAVINYLLTPKMIASSVGKGSGMKGWLLAIGTGIFSHGPVYAWYPMLKDLKQHGMRNGLIAAFLYNRAIKIPLLPMMIYYFGLPFVMVLLVWMILASFVEGIMIDMLDRNAA